MELLKKLIKIDEEKLLKNKQIKQNILNHQVYLNRYKIDQTQKTELDYFYTEALVQTLKNKEIFEGSFVKSYDDMYDYWQTLNYEERKKLINVDINNSIIDLPYVLKDNEKYYLPIFNDKINKIYETEMVLFELKQYNKLRFDCKEMIDKTYLPLECIKYNFTSLKYIDGNDNNYYAYCEINKTLYHVVNNKYIEQYTLVNCNNINDLYLFTQILESKDEEQCLNFILNKELASSKVLKKICKKLERRK